MKFAERLLSLAKEKSALLYGDFQLASGVKSNYYFDLSLIHI